MLATGEGVPSFTKGYRIYILHRRNSVTCRDRSAPSPDWKRASRLGEPKVSLGAKGEGLARDVVAFPVQASSRGPVPHPSSLSVSPAFAGCDAKAGSPLPKGERRGVCAPASTTFYSEK